MLVLKFGGTSVGKADAFAQVAKIVAREKARDSHVVVITSAMSGVTNALIGAAQAAANGEEDAFQEARVSILAKHQAVAEHFIADHAERAALNQLFDERLGSFERLCRSIAVLGELTNRGLDVVSGLGERLAAPLLAAVLRAQGIRAEAIDATELLVTDNNFGSANPLLNETETRCNERLLPLLQNGVVPVVTGFIGATADGIPTTLGRGGSDYSAALFGAVLNAAEIQIWTDVNGVLTADPRIVQNARSLAELSYTEAAELAYFGAKVLHPKTILPAIEKGIPLRVLNTFNPDHPGTVIVRELSAAGQSTGNVKAITAIKHLTLISVAGKGMIGVPGIAARTFAAVARVGANVLMISQSSSEQSITFVVPKSDAPAVVHELEQELHRELERHWIDSISGQDDSVIVAVVGAQLVGTPGLAARVFGALGKANINVVAIAQGSSEVNISLVVVQKDADEAVRLIHAAFELDKVG